MEVQAPAGHTPDVEAYAMFTTGLGKDLVVTMKKIEYKIFMQAPADKALDFIVLDRDNKSIGSCDGETCEVPVPGPGEYRVQVTGEGYNSISPYFTLTDEKPTTTSTWE
jgi:hypothetical protein